MKAGIGVLLALVLVTASSVQAHHSFAAQYDANKPVTLAGTVTKIEWTNPHARFYVDVKDDKGVVTNWNPRARQPERASPQRLDANLAQRRRRSDSRRIAGEKRREDGQRARRHTGRREEGFRRILRRRCASTVTASQAVDGLPEASTTAGIRSVRL